MELRSPKRSRLLRMATRGWAALTRTLAFVIGVALMGGAPGPAQGAEETEAFCSCTRRRCPSASEGPCLPCNPRRLLVGGAALASDGQAPVYWILEARHRRPRGGELRGALTARAEQALELPRWPGFPGTCDGETCVAEAAAFDGALLPGRRFAGIARYAGGATCALSGRLEWASPSGEVTFTCHDAAGATITAGILDIQLIRALSRSRVRRYCGA
jgi:hypothetical protein